MIVNLYVGAPFENKNRQVFLEKNPIVTLGNGSYIDGATMDVHRSSGHILIGNYTSIAYNVSFVIGRDHETRGITTYPLSQLDMGIDNDELGKKYTDDYKAVKYGEKKDLLIIGHDVWIGRDCMIMGGIHIGNGAVIGAGSVVAKDIPPYCVAVGNPVRIIKKRFSDDIINKLEKIKWWYWPKERLTSVIQNISDEESVENFIKEFYRTEKIIVDQDLVNLKKNNKTIIYWQLPIDEETVLHVIEEYLNTFSFDDNVVLLTEIDGENEKLVSVIRQIIVSRGRICPQICTYVLQHDGSHIMGLFSQIDYILLNKDFNSVIFSDYALDYKVVPLYSYTRTPFQSVTLHKGCSQKKIPVNKKILFIGNSLTLHGHAEYWWGTWGMAASRRSKDYVHVLQSTLMKTGKKVDVEVVNFAQWEMQFNDRAETFSLLEEYLKNQPDIIVLQLGENIQNINTLKNDFRELISFLKEQVKEAGIIIMGNFWPSDAVEIIKKEIVVLTGSKFVDYSDLWNKEKYYCHVGTKVCSDNNEWHIVDHAGVAKHPGDEGHQELARRLFKVIDSEL